VMSYGYKHLGHTASLRSASIIDSIHVHYYLVVYSSLL